MLSRDRWEQHGPIFSVENGALEDFYWDGCRCYYVRGPNLQNMGLFSRPMSYPFGPVEGEEYAYGSIAEGHTRLYRATIGVGDRLITQVWPGLPKAAIWIHRDLLLSDSTLTRREVFIAPADGTLYSVVAGNPAAFWGDNEILHVFFEGRTTEVKWRIFHATWHPSWPKPVVDKEPLWDGANPSVKRIGRNVYLYWSKWTGSGFETWCAHQQLEERRT